MKKFINKYFDVIVICVSILIVAVLGSVFVNIGMNWYNLLIKPKDWIANFIIPVCWTIIYLLSAVILSILAQNKLLNKKIIVLGILNGIFNILWCLIFFTFNQLLLGNIFIIFNCVLGILFLVELLKINKWYTYLMLIYPIWLLIATTLNIALWILN